MARRLPQGQDPLDNRPTLEEQLARAQTQLAAADRLAEAAQGVKDAPWSIHEHEDLQAYNRAWFELEQALAAFREVRRG